MNIKLLRSFYCVNLGMGQQHGVKKGMLTDANT